MNNGNIIKLDGIFLGYGKNVVLRDLNFEIGKGDFIGIIGPNGSGKTTILRALLGLLKPLSGTIHKDLSLKYSYVKQRQFLDPIYPFTVMEIVLMGRYSQMGFLVHTRSEDIKKVRDALEIAGVPALKGCLFKELSEGQKQRVLIARALVSDPNVLLLDEPTNDLDIKGEEQIMCLLRNIHNDLGTTVIMVSHLLNVVLNYAQKILFLNHRDIELYDVETLCKEDLLKEIYGIPLKIERIGNKLTIITGDNDGSI